MKRELTFFKKDISLKEYAEKTVENSRYCLYLKKDIDEGFCYDLQMITGKYIRESALPELQIDREKCLLCCAKCKYRLL